MPRETRQRPPSLRVCVRARPLLSRDGEAARQLEVDKEGAKVSTCNSVYSFDRVFDADASQQAVAHECAAELVDQLFDGVHGCLFAYGQTGAGKTFSMLGAEGGQRRACQDGVIPLVTTSIFRRVAQLEAEAAMHSSGGSQYQLRATFVEIYRERVFDLCARSPTTRSAGAAERFGSHRCQLRLRELEDGSMRPEGATEVPVHTTAQLLEFVRKGSAARATASTGVHEHSSRSHAILTLTLERRWRDSDEPADSRVIQKQQAQLSLVDLAGSEDMMRSHGGLGDKDGIATNMGLHALTRVLHALADGAPHVPYRDATLTRLLQPALGGDCVTQMLACISPAADDEGETDRTLRWAATARGVASQAIVHVTQEFDTNPMLGDVEDTSRLQRRALWIGPLPGCSAFLPPGADPVFARVAGDPSKPLLLYVHGSGPRNSSMFWNQVVEAVESLSPDSYYHVAIDCPGYGRSRGDRQIIRSYPAQFLKGIIQACGKHSAAALIGSSQGACAVLNALLEQPLLAESVAVIHPVGHAVERYQAIKQPALLIFDTEDTGHPVEVGRRMRDALPWPTYYEFTHSIDGPWEQQNIAPELIKLLHSAKCKSICRKSTRTKLPELSILAGGMRAWSERHGNEHGWDWSVPKGSMVEEDAEQFVQTLPRVESNSLAPTPGILQAPAELGETLFSDEEALDEEEMAAAVEAAARAQRDTELQQKACELCSTDLAQGAVRLVRCRHALCGSCCDWSLRHFKECPICQANVDRMPRSKKAPNTQSVGLSAPQSDEASLCIHIPVPTAWPQAPTCSVTDPPKNVLVVSYGNTSGLEDSTHSGSSGKTNYSTFVQVGHGDRSALSKVSFNINPRYNKPTATLTEPNGTHGKWSFDYAMARSYPCEMTLHFVNGLPPLTIKYWVQDQRKFTRSLAVELPKVSGGASSCGKTAWSGTRMRPQGIVLEKEQSTSSGWFLRNAEDSSGWSFRAANCPLTGR